LICVYFGIHAVIAACGWEEWVSRVVVRFPESKSRTKTGGALWFVRAI
jgi:hypothetical protein